MAMRLLHGCEEAAPLLDRVIGSLHPRQTQNNGTLMKSDPLMLVRIAIPQINHACTYVPGICHAASLG
jgi:hypothetical protein